jgi:DNA-binding NtrC family response regulator
MLLQTIAAEGFQQYTPSQEEIGHAVALQGQSRERTRIFMKVKQLQWAVVVDDDVDLAETIAEALATDGWDVTAFGDSTQALAAITGRAPAIIICDIEMPGMNGVTLATKALQHLQHCRIVLMSGTQLPKEGAALIAQNSERIRFYAKPVSMGTLRTLLTESTNNGKGASA